MWGSSSKKRPNAITILRIFDGRVLDMVELLSLPDPEEEKGALKLPVGAEMKPMILFTGSMWDDTSTSEQGQIYSTIKSLFLDIFSGEEIKTIHVEGLQYLMMIAAGESEDSQTQVIHLRWYKIRTRKSGQKLPRVELDEVGPRFNLRVGRFKQAEASVMKEALKQARRTDEAKTKKNIETDLVGDKMGRVHLGRQDLSMLQTRKMKGLKRGAAADVDDEDMALEDGMDIDEIEDNEDGPFKRPRVA